MCLFYRHIKKKRTHKQMQEQCTLSAINSKVWEEKKKKTVAGEGKCGLKPQKTKIGLCGANNCTHHPFSHIFPDTKKKVFQPMHFNK